MFMLARMIESLRDFSDVEGGGELIEMVVKQYSLLHRKRVLKGGVLNPISQPKFCLNPISQPIFCSNPSPSS